MGLIRAEAGECMTEQFIGHKEYGDTFNLSPQQVWILFTDEFLHTLMDTFHSQDKKFRTAGGQHVTPMQLQLEGSFYNKDDDEVKHRFGEPATEKIITAISYHEHETTRNFLSCIQEKMKRKSPKSKW